MLCSKAYMMLEVCPPSWELIVCVGLGLHRVGRLGMVVECVRRACVFVWKKVHDA